MKRLMAVILMGTALLYGSQQSTPAEKQLQAAINKEVVEGELKAAIDLYSKLAQSADRAVAAKALVRMGECYEKLGAAQSQEAQKAYERVVRDFADQKESLAAAQKHLAEKAAPLEPGIVVQRVAPYTDKRVYGQEFFESQSISRDGRYLVFSKDDGVYLQDLIKGTANRIVRKTSPQESFMTAIFPDGRQVVYVRNVRLVPANSPGELHVIGADGSNPRLLFGGKQGEILMPLAVSPDGRQVAYVLGIREGDSGRGDFYVVDADGSTPRRLYSGEKDEFPLSALYSPDGKHLLLWAVREEAGGVTRLLLISVADGSSRVIGPGTGFGQFSPDGRYISYYRWGNPISGFQGGIYMAPTDGGKPVLLAGGAASDPRWAPDGKRIIFRDQRPDQSPRRTFFTNGQQEPCDFYSVRVVDGKREGKPELMKKDAVLPGRLLGATQDGSFYYGYTAVESRNIYIVNLDPATGKAVSKPERFNKKFINESAGLQAWSPDGQLLAHTKWQATSALIIHSTRTAEERELKASPPLDYSRSVIIAPIQWFPDGPLLARGILNGHWAFFKVDVQTGQSQMFFDHPQSTARFDEQGALSLDGKFLFYIACEPGTPQPSDSKVSGSNTLRLMRRNMENGDEKELYQGKSPRPIFNSLKISSDGRQLAFTIANLDNTVSCVTVTMDGGNAREIYRSDAWLKGVLCWMKDGRHILVEQTDPQSGMDQVWTISTAGGQPVPAGITFPFIGGSALHPDGRRVTFTGRQPGQTELWVMKLLPPGTKP